MAKDNILKERGTNLKEVKLCVVLASKSVAYPELVSRGVSKSRKFK